MEAMPAVSSGAEKPPQFFLISPAPRLNTIRHPDKSSKLENDAICGLAIQMAAIQKILGHDRLGTTAIYLNLTDTHVVDEYSQKW